MNPQITKVAGKVRYTYPSRVEDKDDEVAQAELNELKRKRDALDIEIAALEAVLDPK